jgi:hypothetical protein
MCVTGLHWLSPKLGLAELSAGFPGSFYFSAGSTPSSEVLAERDILGAIPRIFRPSIGLVFRLVLCLQP